MLAELAEGVLRNKLPALRKALTGRMQPHQRFLLGQQLVHIAELEAHIDAISAEVRERLRPYEALVERLDGIPGVGRRTAECFLAEAGTVMCACRPPLLSCRPFRGPPRRQWSVLLP